MLNLASLVYVTLVWWALPKGNSIRSFQLTCPAVELSAEMSHWVTETRGRLPCDVDDGDRICPVVTTTLPSDW